MSAFSYIGIGLIPFDTELLSPLPLREYDIRKLHRARTVIEENFPEWIGPVAICRETQLNQLKLKSGFRHLFHQTPYEFFQELKLREARRLLLEGKESITSIAYLAGYKHASSFSCRYPLSNRLLRFAQELTVLLLAIGEALTTTKR